MNELDRTFAKRANKIEENNWMPYFTYRLSLMEDGHSTASNSLTNLISNQNAANQNSSPPNQTLNITSKPDTSNTRVGRGKRKQNLPEISGIVPLEEKSN